MESSKFTVGEVAPAKERAAGSTKTQFKENRNCIENFDPNVCNPRPRWNLHNSPPMINSGCNSSHSSSRKFNPNRLASPSTKKMIRERKFGIAKEKSLPENSDSSTAAVDCDKYESLRTSHEDIFNYENLGFDRVFESENERLEMEGSDGENGELMLKRCRERLLKEARRSLPEPGSGRVMHLVKAFEKLLMLRKPDEIEGKNEKKVTKWGLPGLQQVTSSSDFSLSLSSRSMVGGRKSRPSSSEASRNLSRRPSKSKQQKAISRKPFLQMKDGFLAEQRGRCKEEEHMKLENKSVEDEILRMPVAQGLPKTTYEPEILMKPPVKESTKPINLILHSDIRAMERAEFDNKVTKKMNRIEQYRTEMERQQKLAEEEEIRRLRKELVHKAQPMPYFDRPFIPRRSVKDLTIPKEPNFHLPQRKKIKCCMSQNELAE